MVTNICEKFLDEPQQYEESEAHWRTLWDEVVAQSGRKCDWLTPWMGTGAPHIKDGNPIFSAISASLRRGVRIVQMEPHEPGLDFQVIFENTEDEPFNPRNIQEMVIACVLSDAALVHARRWLLSWVSGHEINIFQDRPGHLEIKDAAPQRFMLNFLTHRDIAA